MGRIVAARDPAALAEGIVDVATHLDDYRARHAVALDIFDPDKTFAAYEDVFERAIAGTL